MSDERNATLRELIGEVNRPLWREAALARLNEIELQIDELKQELRDEKMAYHMVCGERDSAREAYKRSEDKATALAKELERSNRGPR